MAEFLVFRPQSASDLVNGPVAGKPDHTALRTALWRALHVELDPPPHVLTDLVGLQLAAPDEDWRERPDMDPRGTVDSRLGMVARARLSRISSNAGRRRAWGNTSFWGQGWTRSCSGIPMRASGSQFLKSIGPRRRPGKENGWPTAASRYRVGSGWFPSTSRQEHVGGSNWRSRDLTPVDPPWSRPRASACI